jgi:hypothetical protein
MRVVLCSVCDKVIQGTSRVVFTKKIGDRVLKETVSEPNSDQIVLTECLQCKKD